MQEEASTSLFVNILLIFSYPWSSIYMENLCYPNFFSDLITLNQSQGPAKNSNKFRYWNAFFPSSFYLIIYFLAT